MQQKTKKNTNERKCGKCTCVECGCVNCNVSNANKIQCFSSGRLTERVSQLVQIWLYYLYNPSNELL